MEARAKAHIDYANAANAEAIEKAKELVAVLAGKETAHDYALREARGLCAVCMYLRGPRIAGQAFTDYTCGICGEENSHPNTGVPRFCPSCCKQHKLCERCGGKCGARST